MYNNDERKLLVTYISTNLPMTDYGKLISGWLPEADDHILRHLEKYILKKNGLSEKDILELYTDYNEDIKKATRNISLVE